MKKFRLVSPIAALACLAVVLWLSTTSQDAVAQTGPEKAEVKPIRVLHLTGGCCHDYDKQKLILQAGVEERANVDFTVFHEGGKGGAHHFEVFKKDGWEKDYDVVLYNICFAKEEDVDYIESITTAHHGGLHAVALHCTYHSHHWNAKTDAWEEFLGLYSKGHGPKAKIEVTNSSPDHPVMKGFPDKWTTPQGELYNIQKTLTAKPLAKGNNGKANYDVIWTNEYGKAKVFGTTIGHHNETMATGVYLDLVTRGLLWTVGKLDDSGKPVAGFAAKK